VEAEKQTGFFEEEIYRLSLKEVVRSAEGGVPWGRYRPKARTLFLKNSIKGTRNGGNETKTPGKEAKARRCPSGGYRELQREKEEWSPSIKDGTVKGTGVCARKGSKGNVPAFGGLFISWSQ